MSLVLHGTNGVTYPNGDTQSTPPRSTKVLQIKRTTYATQATLSTGFPRDDTVPQIDEGDQILSIAMTAGHANNLLEFSIYLSSTVAGSNGPSLALYNGATSAIWAMEYAGLAKGTVTFSIVAGSTDAKTYTVRIGDTAGQNTGMNTSSYYGAATPGEEITTLTNKEIEV